VFRTTLDARVIALDMKTGKEIWSVKSGATKDGIAMTGGPLIADGVLITGMAGDPIVGLRMGACSTLRSSS
jgi:alcohol dehydrogenase (cytochrome c)